MNAITHRQFFGDGERDFSLGLPQVHELERLVGAGIGALCKRLLSGDYTLADLHQIIRLGLIGGGTSPHEAHDLMSTYVYPRPIEEAQIIAISVLSAAYFGQPTVEALA